MNRVDVGAWFRNPRHRVLVLCGVAAVVGLAVLGVTSLGDDGTTSSTGAIDELTEGYGANAAPIVPGQPPGNPAASPSVAPGATNPDGSPAAVNGADAATASNAQAARGGSVAGDAIASAQGEPVAVTQRAPVRCNVEGTPQGSLPGDSANNGKKWVTVQRLSGACDLSSSVFALGRSDTRLAWRSNATSFAAFVTDPARPDASAGYADADCAGACSEYQYVNLPASNYNLRVQADGGPWEIVVQQYR